jgi:hypothetical protein
MSAGDTGLTTTLISTAIATAFAAIGWVVNYILTGYRDRENQRSTASLKFIERQLEELYGPLVFLAWEGRRTFEDLKETLGRSEAEGIFPLRSDQERDLWLFWFDKDLLPRHTKVQELLMAKTHLIEGAKMPDSYLQFLDYHNALKIDYLRWKEQGTVYPSKPRVPFPYEFERDTISTFESLKKQHVKYLKKLTKK